MNDTPPNTDQLYGLVVDIHSAWVRASTFDQAVEYITDKVNAHTAQAVQADRQRITALLQRRADAERADFNDSGLALYIEGLIAEIG